jgi:hypothetical protein
MPCIFWSVCTVSQQMHYSDSLLITFCSSYMFRRMYVIIREPSFECPAELHYRCVQLDSPDCPCGGGSQTVGHLLFDCTILQEERERLIVKISRHDNWPVNKSQLGNKYIKHFIKFTNTLDFTKLWAYKPGVISAYKWTINNITIAIWIL